MSDRLIRELLDLPTTMPRCVVEINTFDNKEELRANVEDYVITPTVAEELRELVDRIITSIRRNEPGEGHYVHGAFGSGKSHFMGILGLILSNNPMIWEKDHPLIHEIQNQYGEWLAENPILTVPVYMLGKNIPFQYAVYQAANDRFRELGYAECSFSEASKVIQRFRKRVGRYGDQVWEQFRKETGYSQDRFERMASGNVNDRDALAQAILAYEGELTQADRQLLYPESVSQGVEILTSHAQELGFKGVVYLVDELILYLTGKGGREWLNEFGDVVATVDNRRTHQLVPLWLIVARQKDIPDIAPSPDARVSEREINEEMEHHQDRFPRTTRLPDKELVPIVEERILRPSNSQARQIIQSEVEQTLQDLSNNVRETLIHDLSLSDFKRLYPFHPALIRTLIDVTSRLSRERTAIRLLYELLIKVHPDLKLGQIVPYASLFDTIFEREGVRGGRQHPELEAVWETYYKRLLPVIEDLHREELANDQAGVNGSDFQATQSIVKTILLAQLTTSLRDQITVEHILHLNYTDLKGRTELGAHARIHDLINRLANRSESINFQPNPQSPAKASVSITVSAGPQLSDALQRVPMNTKMRHDAFAEIVRILLGNPMMREGELINYKISWRGIDRGGKVLFKSVRNLSPADMNVPENKEQEFTLFIDYPWEEEAGKGLSEDRSAIERGRSSRGAIPVGFWLPEMLTDDELGDLNEYAQIRELEGNLDYYLQQDFSQRARDEIRDKLPGYKQTKERNLRKRLNEAYLQGEVEFLDEAIRPQIYVETLEDGLERIGREVFRRLHPQHPRFQRKISTQALRRFLDDVLVKAEQSDGSVDKTLDREDLAKSIGEPLELVEIGARRIGIRPQSRYLVKINELASGRQVETDVVRDALKESFGFTNEVVDLFLLYLIKGKGYRVLKNGHPVESATIDFGKLQGVILERGQQLEVHQWTEVKNQIADTWGGSFQAPELTIAAQDELWKHLNQLATKVQDTLKSMENRLDSLLNRAGQMADDAPRMLSIRSALELNDLAQSSDLDSYKGLLAILEWQPELEKVERRDVKEVIRKHLNIQSALIELSPDTIARIGNLSRGDDPEAKELLADVRDFLSKLERQAELSSHARLWSEEANRLIDKRLSGGVTNGGDDENGGGKRVKDEDAVKISRALIIFRGKKRAVSPMAIQKLKEFFTQAAEPDISGNISVEITIEPVDSDQ